MKGKRTPTLRRQKKRPPAQQSAPKIGYYRSTRPTQKPVSTSARSAAASNKNSLGVRARAIGSIIGRNLFLIAIVLVILISTTLSSASVKVTNTSIEDIYRPVDEYAAGVESVLNESIFRKSKLLVNSTVIERRMREMFPEITEVTVVVPLAGRKLQTGIALDYPMLRLVAGNSQQGIVGESGQLLLTRDSQTIVSDFPQLVSITIEPMIDFSPGGQVLTSGEVELLSLLLAEFDGSESYRPQPSSIAFKVNTRRLEVSFSDRSYYVVITPETDARPQIGSLVATMKELEEQGTVPTSYIDARVDGRVFVN